MLPVGIDVGTVTKNKEYKMKTFAITLATIVAGCLLVIAFWGPQGLQMPVANQIDAMTGQPVGPLVEVGENAVPQKVTRVP
jgi:hypothetical protein